VLVISENVDSLFLLSVIVGVVVLSDFMCLFAIICSIYNLNH
jgi:hypothetical protein